MKTFLASSVARAALVVAVVCTPVLRVSAQNLPDNPKIDDVKALAAKPTPKTSDGHPDLNGRWVTPNTGQRGSYGRVVGNERDLIFGIPVTGDAQTDAAVTEDLNKKKDERAKKIKETGPSYKPEFQAKVEAMGKDVNHDDPTTYSCLPSGVPRMGAPSYIVQTPGQVIFLYAGYSEGGGTGRPYSTYRVIPTDGRGHRKDADETPYGDPVGHWEGDTLVIDTNSFDDSTWFGSNGYFHTEAMRVTERFTRKGNTLQYSATVEDPNVLTKPFDLYPVPMTLKTGGPDDTLYNDDNPCNITDPAHDFRAHADHEHNIAN